MDFELSEEQRAIRDMARQFAEKEIAPYAQEWDEKGVFPREVVRRMGERGFFGCLLPERYGGTDDGFVSLCLIVEEISRASSSLRGAMNMQCVGTAFNIYKNGTAEQQEKYIPPLVNAGKLGCFAITEPDVGSDVLSIKTRAVEDGNDYVLNGRKTWISFAQVADVAIVYACTNPGAQAKSLSAFIVDMGTPGITTSEIKKLGSHSFPTGEIVFEDARVPKENMLGNPGDGARILFGSLPDTRVGAAAGALGLAEACLEVAIKYCNERVQFGNPIGTFQMNQAIIADVATSVEAARFLLYRAAWMRDKGMKNVLETSYAKMFAANVAVQAASAAMDIHGAYGYSSEYPVSRYYKDAKLYQIVEGTTNIHRMIIGLDRLGIRKANR